jgi:Concanavalin A-like lectin/glucanases superfamily
MAGAKGDKAMAASPDLLLTGDLGFQKQRIKADEDGFIFDFSDATVHSAVYPNTKNPYPVAILPDGHEDILVLGGTVIRHDDPDTRWGQSYKNGLHNSGLHIGQGDGEITVDGLRVHNTHDGIVVSSHVPDEKYVTIRHVYGTHIRDDAIENDGMHNLTVEDCLFDGAFVGFSSVNPGSTEKPGNDHPITTIRDTLVRLENMPGDQSAHTEADGSGHGRLFKWWDKRAPQIILENNIFVVEDADAWGDKLNDKIIHSKNNVMIWMGKGEFQGKLPTGFKLIKGDDAVFQNAREDWLLRHGYDPDGTLKENLHAPVLDGEAPEPPETEPGDDLVASWELDRSLNGKNQKVVIDHDASLKLDEGTVVLTFTADKLSGTQGLLSKDSLNFDDGGHLSIWLENRQVVARLQSESKSYLLHSEKGAVTAGEASQVAVSFGDEGFHLYVNGQLVDKSSYTGGIADNSEPIVIGADAQRSGDGKADKLSSFFDGTIHDLAIYNEQQAPSQPESPEPPETEPGDDLVASWELDRSLNGKNQKAVIAHEASFELDEGAAVLTFTADKLSGTQGLFSKDSLNFDDGGHLSIWLENRQVVARLQSESKSYLLHSEKRAVTAGEASQVAVSFGDEGFRLYVNGQLVDKSSYTGGIADNSEPIVIGADAQRSGDGKADKLSSFFDGTIHDVAIYSDQPTHDAASTSADFLNW